MPEPESNLIDFVAWKKAHTYPKEAAEDRFLEVYEKNKCPDCGTAPLIVGAKPADLEQNPQQPDYLYCIKCPWTELKEWANPV